MHIAAVQWDLAWEDREANFDRAWTLVSGSLPPPGSMVVLPEMFSTGFSPHTEKVAELADGPTLGFLRTLAKATKSAVLGGRCVGSPRGKTENRATAVAVDGHILCDYSKIHPFIGWEQAATTSGRRISTFSHGSAVCSACVCYDLRFPEVFRLAARRGAEVMVVLANWPTRRVEHWETLLRARAIENQAFVVGVNRTGSDPSQAYPGRSMVVDFQGRVVAEAGAEETVLHADLDLEGLRAWRKEFPVIKDMQAWLVPAVEDGA